MGSGMNRKEAEELASKRSYRWAVNNIVTGKGIKFRKATMIKLHKLAEIADWLDAEPYEDEFEVCDSRNGCYGCEHHICKLEQTEPQNTCDTCIHKDNPWYMTDCDGCTNAQSNYVRKDELTESEYADAYNRGFASAVAMMADRKTEPQRTCDNCGTPRDKCVYCIKEDKMWTPKTEPQQVISKLADAEKSTASACESTMSQAKSKLKDEPQTEKCPFDDPIPCEWVNCPNSSNCPYKTKDESLIERSE